MWKWRLMQVKVFCFLAKKNVILLFYNIAFQFFILFCDNATTGTDI